MDAVEATVLHPPADRIVVPASGERLLPGDIPLLARRDPGDYPVYMRVLSHNP